jgi:hypothetical protein
VTVGAPTGPLEFIHHRSSHHPQPNFDSLDESALYPAFHVMAGLTRGGGHHLIETKSSEPRKAAALAWREDARVVLWLANLTAEPQTICIGGGEGARLQASVLDASGFEMVVASLDALDRSRRPLAEAKLKLDAYSAARAEVDDNQSP